MKKCLLLIILLIVSQLNPLRAQSLFNGPDTVCVNQPVHLTSNDSTASSYYWGFCSGYLINAPVGTNMGNGFDFKSPGNIDIVEDSGLYYGFVVNSATTEFLRLNFGNSLNNTPSVTNFGNLTNGLPVNPTSLFILQDPLSKHWFIFVSGGYTYATSALARIDFGAHLSNPAPNIANFGNHTGLLNGPKGIFVGLDATGNWYGYLINHNTSELIHLDFSFNVSNTPLMSDQGNVSGTLNFPTDLAAIKDNGNWYLFITNEGNSTVSRVDLGTTLDTLTPVSTNLGNFDFRILVPSSISINRDCGDLYAYITDSTTSQLVALQMPAAVGPYTSVDYSVVGGMNQPSGISSIIRANDDLYGFICNAGDSSLTKLVFEQCHHSTIPSYTEVNPPVYSYDTPGVYNVYYVVNQGLPTMQVSCKAITVLPPPPMYLSDDTTLCQNDTMRLYAVSDLADSIRWVTTYNIDTTNLYADSVRVYPIYSTTYNIVLYYPFGCIVDTSITVNVAKVVADAGPDRYILDGASTTLGGPYTSMGYYEYHWTPYQFLSDSTLPNPVANPPYDFTYYLTVTGANDGVTCSSTDTVVVHVNCGEFVLPNVFSPASEYTAVNRFGLLNKEIVKLNYFRIFDRWGNMVFETTDPNNSWDGTYNGKPSPEGVYVWVGEGYCLSGKHIKQSGNVTLMR